MKIQAITSFLLSLLFGLGLGISGMVNPENVLGFLNIFGNWQPALIFVMGFGILSALPFFYFTKKKTHSLLGLEFSVLPKEIDSKLIIGAIVFGIGWGIAGLCPGPALVIFSKFPLEIAIFILSMIFGSCAANFIHRTKPKTH